MDQVRPDQGPVQVVKSGGGHVTVGSRRDPIPQKSGWRVRAKGLGPRPPGLDRGGVGTSPGPDGTPRRSAVGDCRDPCPFWTCSSPSRDNRRELLFRKVVKREFLATILRDAAPVDLRIVGRTLLHAALVGAVAGLMGAAFFAGLEFVQRLLLEDLGGYHALRAARRDVPARAGRRAPVPPLAAGGAAGGRRAGRRHRVAAGARDARRRRRRDDHGVSPAGRPGAQARRLGQDAGVAVHAGHRRRRRARGADHADRRRARLAGRGRCCASRRRSGAS